MVILGIYVRLLGFPGFPKVRFGFLLFAVSGFFGRLKIFQVQQKASLFEECKVVNSINTFWRFSPIPLPLAS